MTKTQNLELDLLEKTNPVDFNVLNGNMEKLDEVVGAKADAAALGHTGKNCRLEFGSYRGNGRYSGYKNRLEFGFHVMWVLVSRVDTQAYAYFHQGTTFTYNSFHTGLGVTWTDNSVEWYSPESDSHQLNAGVLYTYLALGYDEDEE